MKIFVLNLERAIERRESILQHLSSLGIEAEILPAVEGARLPASVILPSVSRRSAMPRLRAEVVPRVRRGPTRCRYDMSSYASRIDSLHP